MDPMTMMAMMQAGQSIIGQKQLGQAAPAPQLGGSPGLLGQSTMEAQMQPQQLTPPSFQGLMGEQPTTPPEGMMNTQMGPPSPQSDPLVGQPGFTMNPGFEGFFKNMDRTLESPSKVIGLGLLSRLSPVAGAAGLLGSGFFNG